MSASTQLASASTMDRLSLYMGTCCRIWIGLYLALCCLTSVTSLMLHVAAVGLLLCILSYFRLPAPEPGEVFRILGKVFVIYVKKYSSSQTILSDCHIMDEINSLLNASRLKKTLAYALTTTDMIVVIYLHV